jgi:hypothetical protein
VLVAFSVIYCLTQQHFLASLAHFPLRGDALSQIFTISSWYIYIY